MNHQKNLFCLFWSCRLHLSLFLQRQIWVKGRIALKKYHFTTCIFGDQTRQDSKLHWKMIDTNFLSMKIVTGNPNYFKTNDSFQNKLMNIICSLFTWKHESLEKSQTFFATSPAPWIGVLISDEHFLQSSLENCFFSVLFKGYSRDSINKSRNKQKAFFDFFFNFCPLRKYAYSYLENKTEWISQM